MKGTKNVVSDVLNQTMANMMTSQKWLRKCAYCGNEFECEYFSPERYCSDDCRQKHEKEIAEAEAKREKERRIKVMRETIPKKFLQIETDRKDLLKKVYGKSVYIYGKTGVGKTVFAASLARRYILEGQSVKWVNVPAFIMKLQEGFRENSRINPYELAKEVARTYGFLILDDLGAEKTTEFVRQILYYIINEREMNELPIIITSNFTLKEIGEAIDDRVASRIIGMCEVVKLGGEDLRKKKGGMVCSK